MSFLREGANEVCSIGLGGGQEGEGGKMYLMLLVEFECLS